MLFGASCVRSVLVLDQWWWWRGGVGGGGSVVVAVGVTVVMVVVVVVPAWTCLLLLLHLLPQQQLRQAWLVGGLRAKVLAEHRFETNKKEGMSSLLQERTRVWSRNAFSFARCYVGLP